MAGGYLESNIPASIDIEEMVVGRFTFRQLMVLMVAGALAYKTAFGFHMIFLRVSLTILVGILAYLFGFYRLKKYDRTLTEHLYAIITYNMDQQIFFSSK